jgi:phosphoenolpyruvate synthase/pyruvate phosphate dikinase
LSVPFDERKILLTKSSYGINDMVVAEWSQMSTVVDRETLEIAERKIGRKSIMTTVEGEKIKTVNVKRELAERKAFSDEEIEHYLNQPRDKFIIFRIKKGNEDV